MSNCEICSAQVSELRRGRCWGCYTRWVSTRPVGAGARCLTCGERRRRLLKSVELFGGWPAMCFTCAGQLPQLRPLPQTIAELRIALSRERRAQERRAASEVDRRSVGFERRVGDRRVDEFGDPVDDDMILEITVESGVVTEPEEQTRIRDVRDLMPLQREIG